ncbi:unnamed protein product [Parajaminaea phylloscopi]
MALTTCEAALQILVTANGRAKLLSQTADSCCTVGESSTSRNAVPPADDTPTEIPVDGTQWRSSTEPFHTPLACITMDDDDAFLYGDETSDGPVTTVQQSAAVTEPAESSAVAAAPAKVGDHSGASTGVVALAAGTDATGNAQAVSSDDEEDEDEDEDEEDSDSDLEIVLDTSIEAPPAPPSRHVQPAPKVPQLTPSKVQPPSRMPQTTFTSEYTPRSRNDAADPRAITATSNGSGVEPNASDIDAPAPDLSLPTKPMLLPEGPPPFAAANGPHVDLAPSVSALQVPGMTGEGEQMNIYHIDPSSLPEKPWRRPGADLADWFNYGFDEMSWREYGKQKLGVAGERHQLGRIASSQHHEADGSAMMGNQDAMAMMQMMNNPSGASMGGLNPQAMAQMPPQQQMQFMSQMMANGGLGLEAMMAPFLPHGNANGPFGLPHGAPGMAGMFGGPAGHVGMGGPTGFGMPGSILPPMPQQHQPHAQPNINNRTPSSPAPLQGQASAAMASKQRHDTSVTDNPSLEGSRNLAGAGTDPTQSLETGLRDNDMYARKPEDANQDTSKSTLPNREDGTSDDATPRSERVDSVADKAPLAAPAAAFGLPNPAGMNNRDMAAFLGMAGLDVNAMTAAATGPGQNGQDKSGAHFTASGSNAPPQAPAGPSGRSRAVGMGVAGAPRGPSASNRGGRPGVAVPGAPTGPAQMQASSGPVPTGPSKAPPTGPAAERSLPANVPTGPRNPGKRYNDRDTGAGVADALDYGGGGPGRSESRDTDDGGSREGSVSSRRQGHRVSEARREPSRLRESSEPGSPRGSTTSRRGITIKGRHETGGQDEDGDEASHTRGSRATGRPHPSSRRGGGGSGEPNRDSDEEASTSRNRARDRDRDRDRSDRDRDRERERERHGDRSREERREGRRERRRGVEGTDRHRTSQSPDGNSNSGKRERNRDTGDTQRDRDRHREREERNTARASRRAGRDEEDGDVVNLEAGTQQSDKRRRKRGASEVEGGTDDDVGEDVGGGGSGAEGRARGSTRRRR